MRDTIKNHKDFLMAESDPMALAQQVVVRAKLAKFSASPRYGVVATKRVFKLAVQRNRAKRLLRDWVRFNEKLLAPEYDYVFIARFPILETDRESGRDSVAKALQYIENKYAKKLRKSENA
ncbi:MAG: ribonuclease P protein component [Alphaproteobacteria bacterium]|nr:ribonuclease P protein component [Alphaproteobacteria bacterium]